MIFSIPFSFLSFFLLRGRRRGMWRRRKGRRFREVEGWPLFSKEVRHRKFHLPVRKG